MTFQDNVNNQSIMPYTINWRDTTHFDSEDDYRTGCRNVSHCQRQQSYSGLRSPGQSTSTYLKTILALQLCFLICEIRWKITTTKKPEDITQFYSFLSEYSLFFVCFFCLLFFYFYFCFIFTFIFLFFFSWYCPEKRASVESNWQGFDSRETKKMKHKNRGGEWSIKIFNCSQNFTIARFARKL